MARRTAKEVEELREAITQEALAQFATRGMDATSVGDIAKAVGISKQALMHHFRTKEALRDAIVERHRAVMMELLPRMVAAFTASETQLDDVIFDMMDLLDEHKNLSRLMLWRVAFNSDVELTEAGEAIASLLVDYLRRGQESGKLRQDFIPEDALFCLGMMFLLGQISIDRRGPELAGLTQKEIRLRRHREMLRIARAALVDPTYQGDACAEEHAAS